MQDNYKEYMHHLDKVCSDYSMNAADVCKVLNDVSIDTLKNIFTFEELKSTFCDTKEKKIKNAQTRKFIKTLA